MRDGKPLRDQQFTPDSTRYYKYVVTPLTTGHAVLHRADGATVALNWDIAAQPHLAVWCWEGEVPGINHLAPEPTTAPVDTLTAAIAAGQAPAIPAHGSVQWRISLEVSRR